MKKIIYILTVAALLFTSCSNFLETLETPNSNQTSNSNTEEIGQSSNGTFHISFDLNGHGNQSYNTLTNIPLGTEILINQLPAPLSNDDYIFDGWYDDTNTKIDKNFILRRNYNLKARWRYYITEEPVYLPNTTTGTDELNSRYVLFGDFPQTIKANDVVIDEKAKKIINGFECFKGSDNCYYVKRTAINNNLNIEGMIFTAKKFSNNELITKNTTYYFKMEPIKWRVLDSYYQDKNQYLLIAENIIDATPYYNGELYNFRDITYKNSTVRASLLGLSYNLNSSTTETKYEGKGILQTAFSSKAQKYLIPNISEVDFPVDDKIFLLNTNNISKNKKYFDYTGSERAPSNYQIIRYPSDYAKANEITYYCNDSTKKVLIPRWNTSDNNYVVNSVSALQDYDLKLNNGVVPAIIVQTIKD